MLIFCYWVGIDCNLYRCTHHAKAVLFNVLNWAKRCCSWNIQRWALNRIMRLNPVIGKLETWMCSIERSIAVVETFNIEHYALKCALVLQLENTLYLLLSRVSTFLVTCQNWRWQHRLGSGSWLVGICLFVIPSGYS